jgi:alpha-tubulin suppressor-like RCC1 family protein
VQVSNLTGVTAIAGGYGDSLVLQSDGSVWAWGYDQEGQLGNGTTTGSSIPVLVSNLSGVTAIAGGGSQSLAVKRDGTVWAWGEGVPCT